MSRIGKKPIEILEGVEVKVEGNKVKVKGPKGELEKEFSPEMRIELKEGKVFVSPQAETPQENQLATAGRTKKTKALWGLTRALISNLILGVTNGFEKKLEIEGLGYRASTEEEELILQIGFTHPVKIKAPAGIKFLVEKNIITVLGPDKELVGQIAAKVRKVRPPEPYKGKGIRYIGEQIRRKAGKRAVTAG